MIQIEKGLVWRNVLFFGSTTIIALVGLPVYAYFVGLKPADWILFAFMSAVTMLSTTLGYHRLFAHRAFKAHPVLVFLNLFFGAAAFEGSAINWASGHRNHHRYTDTENDPYDIKKGFWFAHMGWFLNRQYKSDYENVKDLSSNKMIQNQHDYWIVWAITAGIAFPLLVGYLTGSFWGAFFLGVCGRFFFIHQSVFLINSACHMFGKPTYDLNASARDSWVCAFLTHGEGFHSYHHRFPSDYRNGVRWYQWDPTKWTIRFLSWLGLASDLNRTPEVQIMAVRTEVEHQKLLMDLSKVKKPAFSQAIEHLNEFYLSHKSKLKTWEACAHEYQQLCRKMTHDSIEQLKQKTLQMEKAREDFFDSHREWLQLTRRLTYLLPT